MKKRALVVDDDLSMQHIVSAVLAGEGCEVVTAGSGREALSLAREGEFSLVVVDVLMPGRVGARALVEYLQGLASPLPVIVISAYWDTDPELREYFGSRVAACLMKPFDINVFREKVRQAFSFLETK